MRRARIKVQAIVPVRRKPVLEASNGDNLNKPSLDSDSTLGVEKNVKIEQVENTREDRVKIEKHTESEIHSKNKLISNLPKPVISGNEAQNTAHETRDENKKDNGEEENIVLPKSEAKNNFTKSILKVNIKYERENSIISEEQNSVESEQEMNNVEAEVHYSEENIKGNSEEDNILFSEDEVDDDVKGQVISIKVNEELDHSVENNELDNADTNTRQNSGKGDVIHYKDKSRNDVKRQFINTNFNEKTNDSPTNNEQRNVEIKKERNNEETEVNNREIHKRVATVENNKNENNFNNNEQIEQEICDPFSLVEASPIKHLQNRSCFMRPVPRLDSGGRVRKNSVQGSGASASESEDDSRKSLAPTRVRNDSICSVQSNKDGSNNTHSKLKVGQQKRRLTVSESARKLAEARREFMLKHENKTPDRSKLTMYDLIYYNPVSNPMKRSDNSVSTPRKLSVCSIVPEDSKDEENEDEPTAMPVPQVKVGPDGQLIVDEKSLVIEQTKKDRNRSDPIVQDENSGGGFYKRRQKSKEWSKWDTLRFYRALSNIGTDFLLMQSFFPKRTRQELKLKFKKEERLNRKLVEKALKFQVFDMEALKEEMVVFAENEKRENEIIKSKSEATKKQQKSKRVSKCRFVIGSIEEIENSCEEDVDDDLSSGESRDESSQKKSRRLSKRKRETTNLSEFVNEEVTESSSDTEDIEIYHVKPTRSGRLPKRRKLQAPNVDSSDESSDPEEEESPALSEQLETSSKKENTNNAQTLSQDLITKLIPNARDIEPGSLVIFTRDSPEEPGKTVVQVYMVSKNYNASDPNSEQNITPVNLSPEVLASVNSKILEAEPVRSRPEIIDLE